MRHIHLDLVGGLSGDMFISGVLDAFPELGNGLEDVIADAGFPDLVALNRFDHNDGTLTGTRFTVEAKTHESHHHRHHAEIRQKIEESNLDEGTKAVAKNIFLLIAEVEARIHGKTVDSVAFHEVGAWDSIADIVLAAHLISEVAASWSISPIPVGRGFVETAHGRLPVPAPATAMLLEGFEVMDDGLEGERVTPTGAGILKHLAPATRLPGGYQLKGSGFGFGTKTFPGISNTVRVSVFEKTGTETPWDEDQVVKLAFEIDDMSPEALASGLEQLRCEDAVLDVTQMAGLGKKGRQVTSVNVLAQLRDADQVISRCFELTTTLGVRRETVGRAVLRREEVIVHVNERPYRVKVAYRPGGATAKIEMDELDVMDLSHAEQEKVRQQAQTLALQQIAD